MKKSLLSLLLILGACSVKPPSTLSPQEQAIAEAKVRLPQEVLQNTREYKATIITLESQTLTNTMIEQYMINNKYLSRVLFMCLNGTGIPTIDPDMNITKNQWNNNIFLKGVGLETLEQLPIPTIYNKDGSEYTPTQGSKFYKTVMKQQDGWHAPCIDPDRNGEWFKNVNGAIGGEGFVLINVTDQELKMINISENSDRYTVNTGYYEDVYNRI